MKEIYKFPSKLSNYELTMKISSQDNWLFFGGKNKINNERVLIIVGHSINREKLIRLVTRVKDFQHASYLPLLDWTDDEEKIYLVYPFIKGAPISTVSNELNGFLWEEITTLLMELMDALKAIIIQNIPSGYINHNWIWIDEKGHIKIIGLGLAPNDYLLTGNDLVEKVKTLVEDIINNKSKLDKFYRFSASASKLPLLGAIDYFNSWLSVLERENVKIPTLESEENKESLPVQKPKKYRKKSLLIFPILILISSILSLFNLTLGISILGIITGWILGSISSNKNKEIKKIPLLTLEDNISGKKFFPLKIGKTLIGRSPTCDITIPDSSVSSIHARIWHNKEGKIIIEDLGSTNGIYIFKKRKDKVLLRKGLKVMLGRYKIGVTYISTSEDILKNAKTTLMLNET